MHRRDDEIERGQALVVEIERAVRPDVAFDAGQQPDADALRVDRADARRVFERAALVEPVGHGQRLCVVGDGDVLEAGGSRGRRHRAHLVLAIRRGAVHVEVAAQIAALDEARQRARLCRFDFPAHLAKLGCDPIEAERVR